MPLNLNFSAEDERVRGEIREFLHTELTDELIEAGRRASGMFVDRATARTWQQKLHRRGWGAVHWPVQYGGTGWSAAQLFIFREECARAGVPSVLNQGATLLAPALFAYASDAQKAYYLPRILSGEHYWCQGYSEPGSGSDLASLKTRADRDGDEYIVNGTKIWTTHAHFADHIFCLVRTRSDGRPQQGISFLLMPMDTPGIRVKPIITLAGDHEVNQVFFDDVRVPVANRVGDENQGWTVAKHLLEYERGSGGVAARLKVSLDELKRVAAHAVEGAPPLAENPAFAEQLQGLGNPLPGARIHRARDARAARRGPASGRGCVVAVQDRVGGRPADDRHAAARSGGLLRRAGSRAHLAEWRAGTARRTRVRRVCAVDVPDQPCGVDLRRFEPGAAQHHRESGARLVMALANVRAMAREG